MKYQKMKAEQKLSNKIQKKKLQGYFTVYNGSGQREMSLSCSQKSLSTAIVKCIEITCERVYS